MKYILKEKYDSAYNAGSKARDDVEQIVQSLSYQDLDFIYKDDCYSKSAWHKLLKNVNCFLGWHRVSKKLQNGDVLLIQHPMQSGVYASKWMLPRVKKKKQLKLIAVIHDLPSMRGLKCDNTAKIHDFQILQEYDCVISHNSKMTALLSKNYQISSEKIANLEIFDYLYEGMLPIRKFDRSVVIAGNLNFEKCPYVRDFLQQYQGEVHLYGVGIQEQKGWYDRIHYHGAFPPSELPLQLKGSFGIVWDGISIESCAGSTGTYLKYNNSHKTSLYLSAGVPVVVWEQAAMADFVRKHHVGIVVSSLLDLEKQIQNISEEEYQEMVDHVMQISEMLRDGIFLKTALRQCEGM